MTPTQIKQWFAEDQARLKTQIKQTRESSNRATAGMLRPLRKINQTAFAALSGIDRSALSKLEKGQRNWNAQLVAKYLAGVAKQKGVGR